ncbi:hypothetical protein [Streptomyces sp. NPDC047315]|uniref:hypothetical protein n=1 Tax=Streptomyces sp. NPDC047315 TaxID=3155142 RepID=UPI0033F43A35
MSTNGDLLRVNLQKAQHISRKLTEFERRINSLRKRLEKAGRNTLGTRDLDDACDDFQDRWDDGLERLKEAANAISGNFDNAMQVYAGTDVDVRNRVQTVSSVNTGNSGK